MKFNKVISPAALFLLLGAGANVYGQHEEQGKQEKSQPRPQQQERAAQPREQPTQRAQQPPQQQRPQAQPQQRPQPQRAEQTKPAAQPREENAQRSQQPQAQPKPAAQPREQQAQHAQQPRQQQQRAQPAQPAQRQQATHQAAQQARPGGQNTSYAPPQRTRQQAQTWQKQSSWRSDGAWQEHASWQQDRSSNWQSDHRTWGQRGGYGGYYIPQASFSLNFGIGHWFRIQNQPIIVGGYPRFQYGGYSFLMVDPWPGNWAPNWYSADDVYVGYDNGYYLYNRQYPGEAIAITVVL